MKLILSNKTNCNINDSFPSGYKKRSSQGKISDKAVFNERTLVPCTQWLNMEQTVTKLD